MLKVELGLDSARRAGDSPATAYGAGPRLLTNVVVQQALTAARLVPASSMRINRQRVALEYARIAFAEGETPHPR